jgi:hypothetical protein
VPLGHEPDRFGEESGKTVVRALVVVEEAVPGVGKLLYFVGHIGRGECPLRPAGGSPERPVSRPSQATIGQTASSARVASER